MILEAIKSLAPNAQFSLTGNGLDGLDWLSQDIPRPSDADILAEADRLTVEAPRLNASLEKSEFLLNCVGMGILSSDEAIAASNTWPPRFLPALSGMPEMEALRIQLEWPTITKVHRTHPMLPRLVETANLGNADDVLDKLFGITST